MRQRIPVTKPETYNDDEIDLFELIASLWAGKWIIVASCLATTLSALLFLASAKSRYEVASELNSNIYSVVALQHCDGRIDCAHGALLNEAVSLLGNGWEASRDGSSALLETTQPSTPESYQQDFIRVANMLKQRLHVEAQSEIELISEDLTDALSSTERVATNILNAKRVMHAIDAGHADVYFDVVSVTRTSPRAQLVLALSLILGSLMGSIIVLTRNAILSRRGDHNRTAPS